MIIAQALVSVKQSVATLMNTHKEKGTRATGSLYLACCGGSYLQYLEGNYDTAHYQLGIR